MNTLFFYIVAMFIGWLTALGFMINIILNESAFSVAFIGLIFSSVFFSVQALSKIDQVLKTH